MNAHEGVCISCHKGGTLNCMGICSKCNTAMATAYEKPPTTFQDAPTPKLDDAVVLASRQQQDDAESMFLGYRRAHINPSERATILAALTFWRQCRLDDAENRPPPIQQIATNGGTLPTVTREALIDLTTRLDGVVEIIVDEDPKPILGTLCGACGEPQYATPAGPTCENGHGGCLPLGPGEVPAMHKVQYKGAQP